jgi:hypothetical protein
MLEISVQSASIPVRGHSNELVFAEPRGQRAVDLLPGPRHGGAAPNRVPPARLLLQAARGSINPPGRIP